MTSYPWLPIELLKRIILETWRINLTNKERLTLLAASFLVNKTWMHAFADIFSEDVHIPSPAFARYFIQVIHGQSRVYKRHMLPSPNVHCKTITYTLQSEARPKIMRDIWKHEARKEDMGLSVAMLLYDMRSGHYMPQFHHLIINYVDWYTEDIFSNLRFTAWADQITHIEVNFLNTEGMTMKGATEDYEREPNPRWYLDDVREMTVMGGSVNFVAEMVATCEKLERLTIDGGLRMTAKEPLPESVQTITFREHPGARRQGSIEDRVSSALKGLPSKAHKGKPKVVVECDGIEESAWSALDTLAQANNLTLLHI